MLPLDYCASLLLVASYDMQESPLMTCSTPVGVQCPIFSSLGEFPAIGIGSGVLGFHPYWCPSPFPLLSILGVFHSLLSAIGFQSCFFFTAEISPPIRSTLHLLAF